MKTIVNTTGQAIRVSEAAYNELSNAFAQGMWSCLVSTAGQCHCIIFPDNFEA